MQKLNSFEAVGVYAIKLKEFTYYCEFIWKLTPMWAHYYEQKICSLFFSVRRDVIATGNGDFLVERNKTIEAR